MAKQLCRLCSAELTHTFVDLGMSPPCESYVSAELVDGAETFYPLHVRVCPSCLLVQLPAYIPAEDIFGEYAYFSSYSDSWVRHAERLVDTAIERLRLGSDSFVVEVASNDGYLLQHCVNRGIPCLGIEPAGNVAEAAIERGVPTEVFFLGEETGRKLIENHPRADLVVANNVFGHVPDIVDFSKGMRALLSDDGYVVIEIPHLMHLIQERQFDTIYHEHYQYLTLLTTQRVLATAGLTVVDVEELPTHGGSLRTWSTPAERGIEPSDAVAAVLAKEAEAGLHSVDGYTGFAKEVLKVRMELMDFLFRCARDGATVVGYGAPGKGNTLLNHCGIRSDLIAFVVDRNPVKHGKFLPGTHIPIHPVESLAEAEPDYVLIMPWNLRKEISQQLQYVSDWGGKLVVALPELEVL